MQTNPTVEFFFTEESNTGRMVSLPSGARQKESQGKLRSGVDEMCAERARGKDGGGELAAGCVVGSSAAF